MSDDHSRWAAFTLEERATIHHALRMLAKFPSETDKAKPLADEAWDYHAEQTAKKYGLSAP